MTATTGNPLSLLDATFAAINASNMQRAATAKGNTRISTLAALRGENPPGTRKARNLKRRRRAIASQSRKGNQ